MKQKKGTPCAWLMAPLISLLTLVFTEWIQRGTLTDVWEQYVNPHREAYLAAWVLLFLIYKLVEGLFHSHALAVLLTSCIGCLPATVTFFKVKLRGEPFFPWDLAQAGEATDVAASAGLSMQRSMLAGLIVFSLLTFAALFIRKRRCRWYWRIVQIAAPLAAGVWMLATLFLNANASQEILKVTPDMWYQTRYYRNYGVITSFLTNAQNLRIAKPEAYTEKAVAQLVETTKAVEAREQPMFPESYAVQGDGSVQKPNIIYVMDESFWNVAELEELGVTFDGEVSPNLTRLIETSAYGRAYSPSFGGGTCDVEFEALTGFSKEFLPAGCKPYQQHVTQTMFSLPNWLKTQYGYQTAAVHGYYKRFWSRTTAYPNLGLDTFVGLDDMVAPEKKRPVYWKEGLVTDDEMATQIETLFESMKAESDAPVFLHAVTMQNHTSYNVKNYPEEERVHVLEAPAGMNAETRGALEDFATGVRDADAMLGRLTDYFAALDEPVILVFWGDHYNPIGSSMQVYTATGYAGDDNLDPAVHGMPLLIWSNYYDQKVEFGTVGAYEISPLVMELYGLKQPVMFQYLNQQMHYAYNSRTLGVTVQTDGVTTDTEPLNAGQKKWFNHHWLLQYDLMFGAEYSLGKDALRAK